MGLIKLLVVLCLVAIVGSLAVALFHLATGKAEDDKVYKALRVRITLSMSLFVLLLLAQAAGFIQPHGAFQ